MKRLPFIEYLRTYSCLSVIMIHTVYGEVIEYALDAQTPRMKLSKAIVETFCRLAVPIFIAITGSLLLRKDRELTWKKTLSNISRMLFVLATFGLGYCFIESYMDEVRGINLITEPLINLIQARSWDVMWYIYMLIGLYAIAPLLKAYSDKCSKKDYIILLTVLFVVSSLIPTINSFTRLSITQFYLSGLIYVFYFLLGQYMFRYNTSKKVIIASGVIGIGGTFILSLSDQYYTNFHILSTIFMALTVVFVYSLAKLINPKENKIISFMAKYSFGIYLIHCFWLNILNKGLHIYPSAFPPVVGEFGIFAAVLAASIVSSMVMYRLPGFRKILR